MKKVLFVITTSTNMGDIALCQEWIADLGREDFSFGYVLCPPLKEFIDSRDSFFLYEDETPVKDSILNAVETFRPDALIFGTNAFWNLAEYQGAEFGKFILEPDDVEIPVLSFDPFEIGFEHVMPQSGDKVPFSAVPDWVWALRYMSLTPKSPNARHFCTQKAFQTSKNRTRPEVLSKWGIDPKKRTVLLAISRDRFEFIQQHYPKYYDHLADLFSNVSDRDAHFLIVLPEKIDAFASLPNATQLPFVKFEDFLDLIAASSVYLTDSFISCIVNAFHLGTPSLLIHNTPSSEPLSPGSFLDSGFFPYWVFPYGMVEVCEKLDGLFGIHDCYLRAEVLDPEDFQAKIEALLRDSGTRSELENACREWKRERLALPSPRVVLEEILAGPGIRPPKTAEKGTA